MQVDRRGPVVVAVMVARFNIADLLVTVSGIAITLAMCQRIPEYREWHWNHELLVYKCPEPRHEFTDSGAISDSRWNATNPKAPTIPTAFGIVSFDSGAELFRVVHREGFGIAVGEFIDGKTWPPKTNIVELRQPHIWSEEHYILAQEYGFMDGVHAINNLLATRDPATLRRQLNRNSSYYLQFRGIVAFLALFTLLVTIRIIRGGYISNSRKEK